MALALQGLPGDGRFAHGVHPPERKHFSENLAIEVVPPPKQVVLPLQQNLGAPSESVVKPKQDVEFSELVAKGTAFVSAPIHSPISGKVLRTVSTTLPNGRHLKAVPIKAFGDQLSGKALWDEIFGGPWPKTDLEKYEPSKIAEAIRDAGIVGLGGAAFPTHVKLMPNEKNPAQALLINGCECEPYLTPDFRVMVEAPDAVVTGALLAGRATGAKEIVVGIEDNKPQAVAAMEKAAAGTGIKIAVLKTRYPQGSEKQLIMAILKKEVPLGGLPLDVGVVVSNVGTAAAVARAVIKGKPLTHRVVSITGGGIAQPKNLLVPMGISLGELIDYCGGLTGAAARMVAGGPMMGFAFTDLTMPVTKGTSGVTVLTHEEVKKAEETACVRCGRCVDACPMGLVPTKLALASRHKDWDLAERYHIMGCFECGCCTYVCPASLPIVQLVRMGKALIMKSKKK